MPINIVGAGLGRTGTMSLKLALDQLGQGPCYHMAEVFKDPAAPDRWGRAFDGEPVDWEAMFDGYRASVDWPGAAFWRELADLYPDAKVILSVRDPERWFASTQATIFRPELHERHKDSAFGVMLNKMVLKELDGRVNDRDHLIAAYNAHNAAVRAAIAPGRLLEFEASQGWGQLCAFLGVAEPDTPFPQSNSTEEFIARASSPRPV
jgi:hypothetical protein